MASDPTTAPGPMTTWADIAALGWPKELVLAAVNEHIGNSVKSTDGLTVNTGAAISKPDPYYCYNVIRGPVLPKGAPELDVDREVTIIWSHDNTSHEGAFSEPVNDSFEETEQATVEVSSHAKISVTGEVIIPAVASTLINVPVAVNATKSVSKSTRANFKPEWEMGALPGQIIEVQRTKTTTRGRAFYTLEYGLKGHIVSMGEVYKGSYGYAWEINQLLNNPKGTIEFMGISTKVEYAFKKITKKQNGSVVETSLPVLRPPPIIVATDENGVETKNQFMIPISV